MSSHFPEQKPYMESKPGPGGAVVMQPEASNVMGTMGFVFSIVGLCTCGLLSPLGALFSFIGVFKEPRGFAIAGLVIGLSGTAFLVSAGLAIVAAVYGMILAFMGLATAATQVLGVFASYTPLIEAQQQIVIEWEDESALPTEAEGNAIIKGKLDRYGNQVVYRVKGERYALISPGADAKLDTGDDIIWGYFDKIENYDINDRSALPPEVRKRIEEEERRMGRELIPDPDKDPAERKDDAGDSDNVEDQPNGDKKQSIKDPAKDSSND